jgi:hypothetical protein
LIECGFLSNPEEEQLLASQDVQTLIAQAVARIIADRYGLRQVAAEPPQDAPDPGVAKTPIMGKPKATVKQARAYLTKEAPDWGLMADLYWAIASKYGVRPEVALAQAMHETGKFKFGGLVDASQNNFAGIGATGNLNTGKEPLNGAVKVRYELGKHGCTFEDRTAGVEAHVQHLYAYATPDPLPAGAVLYDPRFTLVKRGCAPYLEDLGGKWAVPGYDKRRYSSFEAAYMEGQTYGQVIRDKYLAAIVATLEQPQAPALGNTAPTAPAAPGTVVLAPNAPMRRVEGELWFGDGWKGRGVYLYHNGGWHLVGAI